MRIELTVNGEPRSIEAPPLRRLLDLLREDLGLIGTKEGCGEGECGACAVLLDGAVVHSCLVPALQVHGRSVVTIEGLGSADAPDRVQEAFLAEGAVQCGFCIPGMVIASHALLQKHPNPTREEIRTGLAGNLCRCTGYERIVRAVERAATVPAPERARAAAAPVSTDAGGPSLTNSPPSARAERSLAAALAHLASGAVPVAGGTDLVTNLQLGAPAPCKVIDLGCVPELRSIALADGALEIGAAATVTELLENPLVRAHAPALAEAAELFGAPAIRNRASLGGNLASASPAADLPPALLALEAVVVLAGPTGIREIPIERFFLAYRKTARHDDELVVRVRIPLSAPAASQRFFKVGTRRAQSIAKVSLAACATIAPDATLSGVRLAAGSVAATPVLLAEAAAVLEGRRITPVLLATAERTARAEVSPIDDVRSSADYRRAVLGRLVRRFLAELPAPR